jgi:multidrug efflux pump subunit AcrA (membrane-fusion protein)
MGFQVTGRVRFAREPGVTVRGRLLGDDGKVLEAGTLIAELENERYKIKLEQAQANVATVKAQALAVKADIDKTIPSELSEAQAEYERARREYRRQYKLLKEGAGAQTYVDTTRAKFQTAEARMAQIEAKKIEKQAELASVEAKAKEAQAAARQAQKDLDDTRVYSPFSGQISKVHVIPGGYVERGQPVATVQMMDPMKVEIAVAPEVDRQIDYNDLMKVNVRNAKEPLHGWVWLKDTVADATTRTFMITLLVRNRQVEVDPPLALEGKPFFRTSGLWNLESQQGDGRAPYFTNVDTLHQDNQGFFVWKAQGLAIADMEGDFNPVFRVNKVRVTPGEHFYRFLQTFTYRELKDFGALNPHTDLLASQLPKGVKEGDKVYLNRERWLLRPGQLAHVDLRRGWAPEGFYVPSQSVLKGGAGHHVYLVKEESDGRQRASKVEVRLGAAVGTFQAIEPTEAGQIAAGMKLIVDGAHYMHDGDPINAFDEEELAL